MELEQLRLFSFQKKVDSYYIIPIWNWSNLDNTSALFVLSFITLFLYGIGAITESNIKPTFDNYIIPIWNWSNGKFYIFCRNYKITLFLYGIGAVILITPYLLFLSYYIIPIWNWSYAIKSHVSPLTVLHYSYMELEHK